VKGVPCTSVVLGIAGNSCTSVVLDIAGNSCNHGNKRSGYVKGKTLF
jgi:hypothetical protein